MVPQNQALRGGLPPAWIFSIAIVGISSVLLGLLILSTSRTLDIFGLVISTVGVGVIFVWGPPQPSLEKGEALGLEAGTPVNDQGMTVAEQDEEVERRRERHNWFSKMGLGLVFLGFLAQLLSRLM